jgi:GNAT superfamily N-acetyltransferase
MWRMSAIPKNEYTKIFSEKMARIKDGNEIEILAEHDGKLIGKCNVIRHTNETKSHTADYGIMILPEYRSLGLGKKLMNVSIKFAREK